MKKIRTYIAKNAAVSTAILLLALLVSACGRGAETGTTEKKQEEQEEVLQQDRDEPEEAVEQNMEEAPGLPPWVLHETEEYSILLTDALDPGDGNARFFVTIINNSDNRLTAEIDGILINDKVRTTETVYAYCDPNQTRSQDCYRLDKWIARCSDDIGEIRKISFTMYVSETDSETYENKGYLEKECTVLLPDEYETRMVFDPIFSMKTDRQVLCDREDVLIELCGLGRSPDDTDLYALTGIVRIVNRTEGSVPVDLTGIRVNGFYIDPYSFGGGNLAAGSERYLLLQCRREDLEKADIDRIVSVELLVLSSEDENTGAYKNAGGSWYPVSLSQAGEASSDTKEDVIIYEDEYVTVAFRNSFLDWHDVTYTDPYGYYHWILVISNKSDENLGVHLEDFMVDGKENEIGSSDDWVWPKSSEIGANSKTVLELQQRTDVNEPVPEISFRVQVRTMGDGKLLHYADEPAVIRTGGE